MYESGENYLVTILKLYNRNGNVRSIDIARELNYSKPSVSRAVGLLKQSGFIQMNENGFINLTESGNEEAKRIFERHTILTEFFVKTASVSREIAEEDACRAEHVISDETFCGIKQFLNK